MSLRGESMRKLAILLIALMVVSVCFLSGCNETSNNNSQDTIGSNPPIIQSFNVIPNVIFEGESATLSWSVQDATYIYIDNGIGVVSSVGSKVVSPTFTTTYRLTAQNSDSSVYSTTKITVEIETPSVEFSVSFSDWDDTYCGIKIKSVSETNIQWNVIRCSLEDETNGESVSWTGNSEGQSCDGKLNYFCFDNGDGFLTTNDIIAFMEPADTGCYEGVKPNHDYKFTMYYVPTDEIMGSVSWTQIRYW